MTAFVRLFPQLHKKAAGIPTVRFRVAVADRNENTYQTRDSKPSALRCVSPDEVERNLSRSRHPRKSSIWDRVMRSGLIKAKHQTDVRINPTKERKSQYGSKHESG